MKVLLTNTFKKSIEKIPQKEGKRITDRLRELSEGKQNLDIVKLKNDECYRLRVGSYRVIFEYREIENETAIICLLAIHRKDAYK